MEKIHNLEVYAKSRNELNEGNQSYFAVTWQWPYSFLESVDSSEKYVWGEML